MLYELRNVSVNIHIESSNVYVYTCVCVYVCVGAGGGAFSPPHIIVLCLKAIQTKPRNKGGIKIRQCSTNVLI